MICKSRQDFIIALREELRKYDVRDIDDILEDFGRHFEEGKAAGETEAQVCEKLGDTEEIARQYMSEENEEKRAAQHVELKKESPAAGSGKVELSKPQAPETGAPQQEQTHTQQPAYSAPQQEQAHTQQPAYSAPQQEQTYVQQPAYSAPQQEQTYTQQPAQRRGFTPRPGRIVGTACMDVFLFSWSIPVLFSLVLSLGCVALSLAVSGLAVLVLGSVSGVIEVSGLVTTGFAPLSCAFLGIFLMALGGMASVGTAAAFRGVVNLVISVINLHARTFCGHDILDKWESEDRATRRRRREMKEEVSLS